MQNTLEENCANAQELVLAVPGIGTCILKFSEEQITEAIIHEHAY